MWITYVLTCLLVVNFQVVVGQCLSADSLFGKISTTENLSSPDVDNQLRGLQMLEKQRQGCPLDSVYTYLLIRIGLAYYRLADYERAIEYTKKAITFSNTNVGSVPVDIRSAIRGYYNLTVYFDSLRLSSKKAEAADSCISNIMRAKTNYYYACLLLFEKMRLQFLNGDYGRCIDYATLGETLTRNYYAYSDKMDYIIGFAIYKTSALYSLNQFSNAEHYFSSVQSDFEARRSNHDLSLMYGTLAYFNKAKGNYSAAIDYFTKAYHYDELSGDFGITAEVLSQIGIIYSEKFGMHDEAVRYFHRGLQHANSFFSFFILGQIAKVYASMHMFDSAYTLFQRAFDRIKTGIDEKEFAAHTERYVNENLTEFLINLVMDKAETYLKQYNVEGNVGSLTKAIDVYKTADRLVGNLRQLHRDIQSKLYWRTDTRRLYAGAIEACYRIHDPDMAFYFFEAGRAVLLGDKLNEQRFLSEKEMLRQSQLQKQVLAEENQLIDLGTRSAEYDSLQRLLYSNKKELEQLEKKIRSGNPLYFQNSSDNGVIGIVEIREQVLKDHEGLLELFDGDSAVYVIAVTKQEFRFNKINKNAFDSLSTAYTYYISQPARLNENFSTYVRVAHELYQLIFQNLALPAGRIIISPDGKYFPFEALATNTHPLTYFVDDHAVSYTYSARYLLNTFNFSTSEHGHTFLGIAPVKFAKFPELTGSDLSLKKVQSYFRPAISFVGADASKSKFLNEFYKYKIIQLYTHATDSGYKAEPMIYFSDSTLSLSDLLPEQKPATELIVLSACQTASGKLYSGEGVFSFNRGFAALGIPSCVSNLWQVNNEATYRLTELFYKYLAKGLPLDVALQKAKKEFRETAKVKEEKLPYYWAAPILVGKTDPIPLPAKTRWGLIAGAAFLASIVLTGWMIRKKGLAKSMIKR